jgi:hypothetical protein
MSKVDWLFYGSSVLCIISLLLFCYQVVVQTRRTAPRPAPEGLGGAAEPHALDLKETIEQMGNLVQSFAKAGPIATTAALCMLFALIAVLSSGLVSISG